MTGAAAPTGPVPVAVPARRAAVAWTVFAVVSVAYLVAILQRSSLGVAAVVATERFDVAATVLSTLGVAQIVVYAACQIPVGVLIDRWGPRPLLLSGAILMAIGQTVVGLADHIGLAVVGRALVGAGDAMTFTAGIRVIGMWFEGRRVPFITQVFSQLGQVGQLISVFPFVALLHAKGWEPAFLSAAACSVLVIAALLVAFATVGPAPQPHVRQPLTARETLQHVGAALRRPGTQLGFWSHFVSQSMLTMFVLLWGVPFLTEGVGLSAGAASGLISITAFVGFVAGPAIGLASSRWPVRRSTLVLGIVGTMAAAWAAVLAWPGTPPVWLLVILMVVLAAGGPTSVIGFDHARAHNPSHQHGSATGIVNVGGFLACFTMMLLVGVVLDLVSGSSARYSMGAFRWAFLVQFPVVGFGVVMLLLARRRVRASRAA